MLRPSRTFYILIYTSALVLGKRPNLRIGHDWYYSAAECVEYERVGKKKDPAGGLQPPLETHRKQAFSYVFGYVLKSPPVNNQGVTMNIKGKRRVPGGSGSAGGVPYFRTPHCVSVCSLDIFRISWSERPHTLESYLIFTYFAWFCAEDLALFWVLDNAHKWRHDACSKQLWSGNVFADMRMLNTQLAPK